MALRLYDKNMLLIEKDYQTMGNTKWGDIEENITYLNHPAGKGYYKEIFFDDIHIGFGNGYLLTKSLLYFESDFETIEMHFALKGKNIASPESFNGDISFEAHQHNILYANSMCGKMQWESDELQLCEINLTPGFFNKFLPKEVHLFDQFREAIEKGNSGILSAANKTINHKMYQVIYEIMGCKREGAYKKMFLESRVIELLLLQLEQLGENDAFKTSLKKSDIDKIYAVRDFILNNLDAASSLVDLAHKAGTNEFTLKKGFKEVFGTTVFGFWNDAKMKQAMQLLTDHNMNVGEVADAIGYKNQRHFSAAFKRKYGMLPSLLKK